MLTPAFLKSKFDAGLPYTQYVASGKPTEQEHWRAFRTRINLSPAQTSLISDFTRKINILCVSGTWCGDCVQQCPILDAIQLANPKSLALRFVDRDQHADLAEHLRICGGNRVPVVLFLNEDFEFLSFSGDRTLSRYRALAAKQLGPSCPLPGAPIPDDEVAATVLDWIEEVERPHLIARLSTKLRQRHGD